VLVDARELFAFGVHLAHGEVHRDFGMREVEREDETYAFVLQNILLVDRIADIDAAESPVNRHVTPEGIAARRLLMVVL